MSGRVYNRKFDWDEAARLRSQGWTNARIAEKVGVSPEAVRLATNGRARALQRNYAAEYQKSGVCVDCGAQISRNTSRPVSRCRTCYATLRATSVRDTTLQCFDCKQWLPDIEFSWSRQASEHRRGRRQNCRSCDHARKRDWRARTGRT